MKQTVISQLARIYDNRFIRALKKQKAISRFIVLNWEPPKNSESGQALLLFLFVVFILIIVLVTLISTGQSNGFISFLRSIFEILRTI